MQLQMPCDGLTPFQVLAHGTQMASLCLVKLVVLWPYCVESHTCATHLPPSLLQTCGMHTPGARPISAHQYQT